MVGPQEFELTRNSYCEASVTRPSASPTLAGRIMVDVCVVGGGYAPLWSSRSAAIRSRCWRRSG